MKTIFDLHGEAPDIGSLHEVYAKVVYWTDQVRTNVTWKVQPFPRVTGYYASQELGSLVFPWWVTV